MRGTGKPPPGGIGVAAPPEVFHSEDMQVLFDAIEWLNGVDLDAIGPETRDAIRDVAEHLATYRHLSAIGAASEATSLVFRCLAMALVIAQNTHRHEAGGVEPATADSISVEEMR